MVNAPVFAEPPGQRPAASIIRDRSLLLVWPKAPAVKVLPGLPLEDVKLAPEKTSDWSATASRASTTRVRTVSYTTSDAADDLLCVDLGGRRIIKKKKNK